MSAPRRRAMPLTAAESLYERIIEVLENQKEIAKEQAAGAVVRDQMLSKMTATLEQLAGACTDMARIIKTHDDPIRETADGIEDFPAIAEKNLKATCHAIQIHDQRMKDRVKSLAIWLPIATFFGALLGSLGKEILPLIHLLH